MSEFVSLLQAPSPAYSRPTARTAPQWRHRYGSVPRQQLRCRQCRRQRRAAANVLSVNVWGWSCGARRWASTRSAACVTPVVISRSSVVQPAGIGTRWHDMAKSGPIFQEVHTVPLVEVPRSNPL